MGFKEAISKWAEDNPLGAKILAQQAEIARLQAALSESNFERDNNRAKLEVAKYQRDTSWNDAIEAAANEAANWWAYIHDDQDRDGPIAESIRALKRT